MFKFSAACTLATALVLTPLSPIKAQTVQDPAVASTIPQATIATPALNEITIPDGTELSCVTVEAISSKTAHEGDALTFKVENDVVINNVVAIAKGTLVKAEVGTAKKSGMFGRGGSLSVRVISTNAVDGQTIKLRASKGAEGDNKTGATVALVVVFGVLGFLKKGKNAEIQPGTKITTYTDEAKTVVPKAAV